MNLCHISVGDWQSGTQLRARHTQIILQPVQQGGRHFTVAPHRPRNVQRTPRSIFRGKTQCCRVHFSSWDLWIANQIVLDSPSIRRMDHNLFRPLACRLWTIRLGVTVPRPWQRPQSSTSPPGALLNLWTVRHDALGGMRALCDPPRVGSVSSGPDEMLLQLCVLSNHTWPITTCATDSCALSFLDTETLPLSSATRQQHLQRATHRGSHIMNTSQSKKPPSRIATIAPIGGPPQECLQARLLEEDRPLWSFSAFPTNHVSIILIGDRPSPV